MMNLSDRAKAITAEDLIRRYDLDGLKKYKKAISMVSEGLTRTNANLENYVEAVTKDIKELQNQVDGNISVWSFNGVPFPSSPPANEWINEEEKNNHLGDLYYDQETGYAYRWVNVDNAYQWEETKDKEVVEALAIANAAKDMADSKRQVFVTTPYIPSVAKNGYDIGDIWLVESGEHAGEIFRCQRSKRYDDEVEEEFESNDWIKADKYTDDSTANSIKGELDSYKEEVKNEYVTKVTFDTTTNSIKSTVESVQIEVDKKAKVFKPTKEQPQPIPPYNVGDIFIDGSNIYTCIATKEENEEYTFKDDWELNLDGGEFATKTELEQTDERITLVAESVSSKVDEKDLISKINVSPEAIELTTNRFSLDSTNAKITKDGVVDFVKGAIGNIEIGENYLRIPISIDYNWTQADVDTLFDRYTNGDTFTEEEIAMYDLNKDGKISLADVAKMFAIVEANISKDKPGAIEIVADDVNSRIVVLDGDGNVKSSMDLGGISANGVSLGMFGLLGTNQKMEFGTNDSGDLYLRATVSDSLQYQLNCFADGRLLFQKCENGTWSNISGAGYRVNDVIITYTDTNPAAQLGGTWSQVDVEMIPAVVSNPFTLNTTNTTSAQVSATKLGHYIFIEYKFVPKVALSDSEIEVLTFNLSKLGVTQFNNIINHQAFTDGGNCIAFMNVAKNGRMASLDVIPDKTISAGQTIFGSFMAPIAINHMTTKGKRYWRRTA